MEYERLLKMQSAFHDYENSPEQKDLKKRIIDNDKWFCLKQDAQGGDRRIPETKSGYLFNAIITKHADAMDNYPDINILAREKNDVKTAKTLKDVINYILDNTDFEAVYSENWYSKLKTCACYSVTWDDDMNEGKGDIKINKVNLLNLFWQSNLKDLQDSEYVFYRDFMTKTDFIEHYGMSAFEKADTSQPEDNYFTQNNGLRGEMVNVIDAYWKTYDSKTKKKILNFAKFSGDYIIFDSTAGSDFKNGYYDHGKYPFFFDNMYPMEMQVSGFGVVDVIKDSQKFIDRLDSLIQLNNMTVGKSRYLVSNTLGINMEAFTDYSKDIVETKSEINDFAFKKIPVEPLPSQVMTTRDAKIAEQKEIIGNRDFQQGGTSNGITSGTALSVLQSVGDKLSRDIIKASYRCYKQIILCVIELIRQFYDEERSIRITGEDGQPDFINFSNEMLTENRVMSQEYGTDINYGKDVDDNGPLFDVKLSVQKDNPYSRELANQTILQLYQMGMFNPETLEYNLPIIKTLQFDGKDELVKSLSENADKFIQEKNAMMQEQQMQAMGGVGDISQLAEEEVPENMVDITDLMKGE